jgi:hypothetical protein
MEKKLRSDSTWSRFNHDQKDLIQDWLLDENLPYKEVQKRCAEQFSVTCSRMAIQRIYQYLLRQQTLDDSAEIEETARELAATGSPAAQMRPAILKMAATRLMQAMTGEKGDRRDIAIYSRILMQAETRDLQRERVQIARDKHEFRASAAALKALPLVGEFTKDDHARERERMDKIRFTLFGKHLDPEPSSTVVPFPQQSAACQVTPGNT